VLAPTYSCLATTIGSDGLNYRVRDENGCTPIDKAPTRNTQRHARDANNDICMMLQATHTTCKETTRDSQNSFREFCRRISTPRLNALLRVHLVPINVIISHGPQTIPNLGDGFPLRCFQRLSKPDIATGRCYWRNSPQTRGQFNSVLSY
jgi:hypothetical protein